MATVKVITQQFTNDNGEQIPYKRLCITGYLGGEIQTLELKLSKSDLLLAELLLTSNEEKPTVDTRKATEDEQPSVTRNENNKLDLDAEDEDRGMFDE